MVQTRTVTILFCDLVGSTALMTRLGDDANDRLRRRLFVALREAVAANRGEEVKSAGDGLMVAFPTSAADAVACAVAMQRAIARLGATDPLLGLAIRVGLSSGEASNEHNDWFGLPVVEAARLEHAARPGQVLCAELTRGLVGNRGGHTFTPIGALELKGLPEPLPACEVAWEPDPGLPAIPLPSGLARAGLPFAGRATELAILRRAWEDSIAGERRFVLVRGEQGMGKTRLAAEFAAAVHGDGFVVLYGRSETDREVPYQPFAEALRWYVLAGQPQDLREQVGAAGGELTRIVPALRMRLPDLPEPRAADPAVEQQALFDAVLHTLGSVAARSPVLLVIDDLEQAGARTLALLRHLVTSPERQRLLVVGLAGDSAEGSPWAAEARAMSALPGCIEVALMGLAPAEVSSLLERVEGPAANPALAGRIHRETEGSPRFVAELIARLHEGGEPEAVLDAACPYMGLRSFETADSRLYFGRDEVIGALLGRLATNRLLSVVGASGSGKSSLVRAGLVPRLRDGALPGSRNWEVLSFTPGTHPLAELASHLGAVAGLSAASVLRDLEADPRTLDLTVRQAVANRPESTRVLLVADQFEELFTLCRDDAERQRFIDALLGAIGVPGGRTMVILAMRADFYGEAARHPGLAHALETSHALLGPMSQEDLRSAIERPAAATGLRVEPGLAERILRDVGDEPGGLPLLSHALLETWKRRDGRTLTAAGYAAAGGVRGAIAQTAETVYGSLDEPDRAIARNLFVRLTEFGEGTEDTRRRVTFGEVVPADAADETVRAVINRLADARLLTTSADSVEVAHEALIREWPRLRGWLDDDREGLRVMRHLTESAQSWERLGRDEGELYRGTRLSAATEWFERSHPELNPLEREFLEASSELKDRELREAQQRLRRLRMLAAGLAGLVVLAVAAGGLAALQWSRAHDARDRADASALEAGAQRDSADRARQDAEAAALESILARLETEIPLLVKTNRGLAFVLAAQAYELSPGPRTASLMNRVLAEDPRWRGLIWPSEQPLVSYWTSADGKYLATKTQRGLLELWDTSSHGVVSSANATPGTAVDSYIVFVPGGLLLDVATAPSGPPKVSVFTVPTLELLREVRWDTSKEAFVGGGYGSANVAFLQGAAAPSCCRSLRIVDVRSGSERTMSLPQLDYRAGLAAFSFDPTGTIVLALLRGGFAILDAGTLEVVTTVTPADGGVIWGDFTPDGSALLTVGSPGRLNLWDPRTGVLLGSTRVNNFYPSGGTGFGSAGRLMLAATDNQQVSALSLPTFARVGLPYPVVSTSFVVTPFGEGDGTFFSWSSGGPGAEQWALDGVGLASVQSVAPGPGRAAVSPDGTWFVKQAVDGSWARWSLPEITLLGRSGPGQGAAANNRFGATAVSPIVSSDGRYIASAHTDCAPGNQPGCSGRVVVWDVLTGRPVGQPIPVPNPLFGGPGIVMAFHPGQPLLAVGGPGNAMQVWSFSGGVLSLLSRFTVPADRPVLSEMAFVAPAGGTSPVLAINGEAGVVSLWDVGTAAPTLLASRKFPAAPILSVTPAGAIVVGNGDGIRIYEASTFAGSGSPGPVIDLPGAVTATTAAFARVSFSTDGRWMSLAQIANAGGRISVWDLETKQSIGSSFNWLQSSTPGRPDDAFMARDGSYVVSSSDGATVIWDLDVVGWLGDVCLGAGRNLTEAEWIKYFPGREYRITCDRWPAKPQP